MSLGTLKLMNSPAEVLSGKHVHGRDDPVLQGSAGRVDVVKKQVQRGDALNEALFEQFPFARRDDPGNQIEWRMRSAPWESP